MKEGFERVTLDTLGGLCTLMDPSDLPMGVASYASNVEFFPGGFRSRDGFKAYLADSGGVTGGFRSIYDFVDGVGTRHHVTYQGGVGRIGSRTTGSTVDTVIARTGSTAATFTTMRSTALYGRLYGCLSDGKRGVMAPMQWDGTNAATSIGASGAYAPYITFSGPGSFLAGRYFVVVAYETNTGYITGTAKLTYASFVGASQAITLTDVPIGPANTVKRRIFISLVDSFELFNPVGLVINDNTSTTTSAFSFTQAEIAAGLPFAQYIDLQPPTAHLGVEGYANRLVMWGGSGRIKPFYGPMGTTITQPYSTIGLINLDFGALSAASYVFATPASTFGEWTSATATSAISIVAGSVAEGETGNYLRMVSPGGSALKLQQGTEFMTLRPNVDSIGTYFLAPGRQYGLRARIRKPVWAGVGGTLTIKLYEVTNAGVVGANVSTMSLALSKIDANWAIYESDVSVPVAVSLNVGINIELEASASANDTVDVSNIETYDLEGKRGSSRLDISRVDDVESFDSQTGVIDVSPNDGQEIRNVFQLKGNLYITKEYSTYVTQDTGQEPDTWSVELVSSVVGTPSVHGVGFGESWVVIASRDGLYLFDGGTMEKISQEIQPTWNAFDWTKGEQMYCAVDTAKQTIIVGGPTTASPYWQQLRLGYIGGFGDPLKSGGEGRAWSLDSPRFVHAAPIRLDSGLGSIAYCTGGTITANTGDTATSASIVYEDNASTDDWNAYITATYRTAPIGNEMERSLFGGIAGKIRGVGTLNVRLVRPDTTNVATWSRTLVANPLHDIEVRANQTDTQLAIEVQLAPGKYSYYYVKRLAAWLKKATSASIRGY